MKSHFDPILQTPVMHDHDLEDISGIYSVASGNLGAIDASAGTQQDPIDPPVSEKSGFWIITVAGYVNLDEVATLFEAGDFLTFDLDTEEYSRIDNKILDATLDISSTFTNSLAGGLVNQKQVNERLDIYVPPAGAAAGSIPYWDGTKRVTSDPVKFKWDAGAETLTFGNAGKIQIGEETIYRNGANELRTNANFIGYGIYSRTDYKVLNKAASAYLGWFTRNTAGAEVVGDLTYIGNITMPYASTIQTNAGVLSLFATGGNMNTGTLGNNDYRFKTNDSYRWVIGASTGTFYPYATNTYDIGTSSNTVKDIYLGGKIYIGADVNLYRGSAGRLVIDGQFYAGSYIVATGIYNKSHFYLLNKAGSGDLQFITRNTAEAEVVGDLTYIGNITMPYAATIGNTTGDLTINSAAGNLNLKTTGATQMEFRTNNTLRWIISSGGVFQPNVTNTYDIGTSTYRVKNLYLAGQLNFVTGSIDANGSDIRLTGKFNVTDQFKTNSDLQTLNKAGSAWISWFTRNTAGAEVVGDLTYIGNITMPYASTIQTSAGNLAVKAAVSLDLGGAGVSHFRLDAAGFVPFTNNARDLGSSATKMKDGYFAGTVYTGVLNVATQTPASAGATGTAGTITWDADFLYVCIAANTWKRAALSTW